MNKTRTFLQEITHSNYIVRDHTVHDVRTLPGVVLLDMIYRLSALAIGTQSIVLQHVLFKQPVVTDTSFDKQLQISFTPAGDHWTVSVKSRKIKNNVLLGEEADDNMECLLFKEINPADAHPFDVTGFMQTATRRWDMDEVYALVRRADIRHRAFMKTLGTVYQAGNRELMALHLGEEAEQFRSNFYAHPAFLDGSTLAGLSAQLTGNGIIMDNTPYIPFMIARFCIRKPLPANVYTYSELKPLPLPGSEPADILHADITLYDESGEVLVEFGDLSAKRIRDPRLIKKLVAPQPSEKQPEKVMVTTDTPVANDRMGIIIQQLQGQIGRLLNTAPAALDIHTGFYDLGLDSAHLLQVVRELEKTVQAQLYPTLLFEYATIQRLAEYLQEHHGAAFLTGATAHVMAEVKNDIVTGESECLQFMPVWHPEPAVEVKDNVSINKRVLVLHDVTDHLAGFIKAHISDQVIELPVLGEMEIADRIRQQFVGVFGHVKEFLTAQNGPGLLQFITGNDAYSAVFASLLKTAVQEQPAVHAQVISFLQEDIDAAAVVSLINQEATHVQKGCREIRYSHEQQREVKRWTEVTSPAVQQPVFRKGGVYVITGGAGGLGLLTAEHITKQVDAHVILLGRSSLDVSKKQALLSLQNNGSRIEYIAVDISDLAQTFAVFEKIKTDVGNIHGIIHAAGIVKDQFIIRKDISVIDSVWSPKANGIQHIDQASRLHQLDFFVVYSSLSAVAGNPAQSDYGGANAFMDVYCALRNEQVAAGVGSGKTLTINWPLWAGGGMQIDAASAAFMREQTGMVPLRSASGLAMLDRLLQGEERQGIVLYGDGKTVRRYYKDFLIPTTEKAVAAAQQVHTAGTAKEDIAIIGVAGRYPGAETLEEFYYNLLNGVDSISEMPVERWKGYDFGYDITKLYGHGGFLKEIADFDPRFFNISPHQAEIMDPQARLFLQTAWLACEDAGFKPDKIGHHFAGSSEKSVGVFAGIFWSHYELFGAEMSRVGQPAAFGVSAAAIPNMVSYCMNFHGPSMAVDTMCSSALTSIHLAIGSVRKGECNYAIAGGVNLVTHPHKYQFLGQGAFLSSDGRCHSFGEGGDGYVPGEGVGAVLLTSLELAEKEGYPIYGVIKGSAINHVGRTSGPTVPDPVAQAEVIKAALQDAQVDPRTISYLEAHGTGTSLGDPIEIQGLKRAFENWTKEKQFCAIGSSKSNIGHLEAAAGIAALTKLLLQFRHGKLFPTLHADQLNPHIPFKDTPFYVQHGLKDWDRPQIHVAGQDLIVPRRAGLSSFGANGSNAHLIVEEYIPAAQSNEQGNVQTGYLIPLSARDEDRLMAYIRSLYAFVSKQTTNDAADQLKITIREELLKMVSELIHIPTASLDPGQEFFELNADIVQLTTLADQLWQQWGIQLAADVLVRLRSVSEIVDYLLEYHKTILENIFIREGRSAVHDGQLVSLAYTLQTGREAMHSRAVFLVRDYASLKRMLSAVIEGQTPAEGYFVDISRKDAAKLMAVMSEDKVRTAVSTWANSGELEKIAALWVAGHPVDWQQLYTATGLPRKINVPGYPFAKEHYWFPYSPSVAPVLNVTQTLPQVTATSPEVPAAFDLLTFEEVWIGRPLSDSTPQPLKRLLCCVEDHEEMVSLSAALQSLLPGISLLFIITDGAAEQADNVFVAGKDKGVAYKAILDQISEQYNTVDGILYTGPGDEAAYEDIFYLLQGILSSGLKTGRLLLEGRYSSALEKCYALSWIGYARSLGFVFPGMDIHVILRAAEEVLSIQTFLGELWHKGSHVVHYENGVRTVPQLEERTTHAAAPLLKQGGTYVVTGGFGGLGLLFSRYLSDNWKANVVMTGRRLLSVEEERQVAAMQGHDNRVVYVQADVSDAVSMEKVRATARQMTGKISGILHIAGVQGHTAIGDKHYEDFKSVLSAKVRGSQVLDEVFGLETLDFVCYFSSSSAVLGDFGSCDYSVANRFQMSYGALRRAAGFSGVTTVINWPLWREGGMSNGESSSLELYLKSSGQSYLESALGLSSFEGLLSEGDVTRLVMYGDRARICQMPLLSGKTVSSASVIVSANNIARSIETHDGSVAESLLWDLRRQVSELLKLSIDNVETDVNLADFGFDSVSLMELSKRLSAYYNIAITPAVFFGYATLDKLQSFYMTEHQESIHRFYSTENERLKATLPQPVALPPRLKEDELMHAVSPAQGIPEPIAVIGMSGRFPQAANKEIFWQHILEGKSGITEIPAERWDWREYADTASGNVSCKWGAFLDRIDTFDPLFFEISPAEAAQMDPKQRLFLEEAWHALEDGGYMGSRIRGAGCGVYVGVEESEYGFSADDSGRISSNQNAILAARIAYTLDLKGPCMALTAACSSGLVAIHQACQALRTGDCEMALAGGINLLASPMIYLGLGKVDMLSHDGACPVFDQDANGMIPGEAVAVVLLKPLSKAIADGDTIYGTIRATGVNYDGTTNGITAPDPVSQAALIRKVYEQYDIQPRDIQYAISHSVGSKLGDPVEIMGLNNAFNSYTQDKQFCHLNSIKPLIGHTFAASGVVSLVTMLMAMKHQTLPGNHHYKHSNEYIDFNKTPFVVAKDNSTWDRVAGKPRLGIIGTTGINGTNAHAVIEEYIAAVRPSGVNTGQQLFVFSAKSKDSLDAYVAEIKHFISIQQEVSIADIAYTLQTGREAMEYRMACVAGSREELSGQLDAFLSGSKDSAYMSGRIKRNVKKQHAQQGPELKNGHALLQTAKDWLNGELIDWKTLYNGTQPSLVHLPGYVFEKDTFPVPRVSFKSSDRRKKVQSLHPLLHQNISTLAQQQFISHFTGEEAFLADHVINGQKILPGVAYMEMVHTAIGRSITTEEGTVSIHNVIWARPLVADAKGADVYVTLDAKSDNSIDFSIHSFTSEKMIHSKGTVQINALPEKPRIDIASLQQDFTAINRSAQEYYNVYRDMGIVYGPFYQGISRIYKTDQSLLVKLVLEQPEGISDYAMHPGMMDAALHAAIGFSVGADAGDALSLPFALETLRSYRACEQEMWSWIRFSEGDGDNERVRKLDVDICNKEGWVCTSIRGLSLREVKTEANVQAPVQRTAQVDKQEHVSIAAPDALLESTIRFLQQQLSVVIKLSADRIEADAPLEKYGIDSVMVMALSEQLEKSFGSLPKTLFFEYQTIDELATYFVRSHQQKLLELTGTTVTPKQAAGGADAQIKYKHKVVAPVPLQKNEEEIAVIGLAGRYPGAVDINAFWENLRNGVDAISEIPADRWDHQQFFDPIKGIPGKTYAKWGGFIEGVTEFDPLFFNISPLEASVIDPQERLFLQCVYNAMEDAGYTRQRLAASGNVGVFAGSMYLEYQLYGVQETMKGRPVVLSGNASSVANRVSYFCNFHGPSLTVDTMCSSSLTALHLACQSLQRGECVVAIAGGVNVSIHPNKYLMLGQGGFASSKGRCESFGVGGDGYVPGEGVGAVLLKPLSRAIADGDHIYGVIRGSAINHGGKTNGYTVPNPQAQSSLISHALQNAGIDARTISYIEAHGTGTSLGDPIEIAGLTKSFREYGDDVQYCAIGSAKSNIGHCESAAGIAGFSKVLLQLQHRELAPSLHAEVLNPHIAFNESPFRVQHHLEKWERPEVTIDGHTQQYPLRAGISAFGAGGSNAHILIEEYVQQQTQEPSVDGPFVILLSAKNTARLEEQAARLLDRIRQGVYNEADLPAIAYTLQTGREAMEERLGMIVNSLAELEDLLSAGLSGDRIYRSEETTSGTGFSDLLGHDEIGALTDKWISEHNYEKLLRYWVKGGQVNWALCYTAVHPRRISLPVYPFAKDKYWFPSKEVHVPVLTMAGMPSVLHPLLHQNVSDLSGLKFTTLLDKKAFFLADHVINRNTMLPGVAYLEMALAACNTVSGRTATTAGVSIKHVTWSKPVVVNTPIAITVSLSSDESGETDFTITSGETDAATHCSGTVTLMEEAPALVLDLEELQAVCNKGVLSGATCYEVYHSVGLAYGPAFQCIQEVYAGEGQALIRLALKEDLWKTMPDFAIHPCIVDAAVQGAIGLNVSVDAHGNTTILPMKSALLFGMQEMEILSACTKEMWAWVRFAEDSGSKVHKLDIDLCDEEGNICIMMKGFSSRIMEQVPEATTVAVPAASGSGYITSAGAYVFAEDVSMLTPVWDPLFPDFDELSPETASRLLVVGCREHELSLIRETYPNAVLFDRQFTDSIEEMSDKLRTFGAPDYIVWFAAPSSFSSVADEAIITDEQKVVHYFFKMIKALLSQGYGHQSIGWTILTRQGQNVSKEEKADPVHASLHGLIGSMAKEHPEWRVRLLDLGYEDNWTVNELFSLPYDSQGNALCGRNGQWFRQELLPVIPPAGEKGLYREGGVYIVIGGNGGIGEVWTEYMIRTYRANIIWIGRRPLNEDISSKLDRLSLNGVRPQYIAADASDRDALDTAYQQIKQEYGVIHGIIHSAVGSLDQSLAKMDEALFYEGLSAKVDISIRLAQVFVNEPLDFVLFFSSIGAFGKALGQSSYATGCNFKDAFARRLAQEWPCAVKIINWGYWGNIGVGGVVPAAFKKRLAQAGIGTIEPGEAMEVLEMLLRGPVDQMAFMKTTITTDTLN
ncbi:Acyl transferase domain-containing protein [Chitinophaga sp. YR627]|uniref:SDR family NAD(P)-dependent oxidoreductase n=1 Tax=Chitinophaga sp. YR627 TaxID=1881041 RepID=UPI0008DFB457|nr:SDR family NAD(P)-dependent oxidoreductase [Chitinophaga sp. YR627]SFM59241.1 Acyl transferase domain-containing protein [Chitinophaga sp. YR627]